MVDLKNSQVSIMVEVNGMVHLVSMEKEKYDAISAMVKMATAELIRTNRSQEDFINYLTNK